MVKVQKFLALILSMTLVLALFSGCSSAPKTDWVLKIDGVEITPGEYLSFQQNAYQNAQTEIEKEEKKQIEEAAAAGEDVDALQEKLDEQSFLKKTIDGKSSADWTNEETITLCKRNVAALQLAETEKVDLTSSDYSDISTQMGTYYTPYKTSYYDYLGIGESSYKTTAENGVRQENLFNHWYGEDGTEAVSEEEIADYFVNNYVKGVVFTVYGSSLSEEQLASRQEALEKAAERLNAGEDYGVVINEYNKEVETLVEEEAAASAAEAASKAGSELSSDESDSDESSEEAESTTEEEDVSSTESESSEVEEIVDEDSTATEEETEEELPSRDSSTQIFNLEDGSSYLPTVVTNAITTDTTFDHYQVIQSESNLYLVCRLQLDGEGDDLTTYKTAALQKMMEDAFDARLDEVAADYTVDEDSKAVEYYTIERFVKRYNARYGTTASTKI